MNKFAQKYAAFVIKHRHALLIFIGIFTLVMAYFIKDLDIRNDPDTLLPESNRYVATNAYGEQKFGFGNITVVGLVLKDCVGGEAPYAKSGAIVHYDKNTDLRIDESAQAKMTQAICEQNGGLWQGNSKDIYQPWFVNLFQEIHNKMVALPHARSANFMDIASQKIKYMGLAQEGGLKFERLIPVEGIDTRNTDLANTQLAHLKKGLEENPVLAPMLLYKQDTQGKRCAFAQNSCTAKGLFIVGDYADSVKQDYLPWVSSVVDIVKDVEQRYGDKVEIRISGEPYFLAYMLYDLKQKWWLFLLSFLIVIIALWRINKGWRGSILPLLGVVASIVITLGVMGFTQYKLTTMMILTPMLLLAIGTGHAVQVVRRYLFDLHQSNCSPMEAAQQAIAHTIVPATLAIITDMVGFFTLSFVDISFYKAYAYFGMFGMFTILITTTTLAPILMAMSSAKQPSKDDKLCESSKFEKSLAKILTRTITSRAKFLPIGLIVMLVGWSVYQTKLLTPSDKSLMPGVEVGINYSRAAFKYDADTNVDLRRLGEIMPGVISVNIPVRGKKPLLPACVYDGSMSDDTPCWDEDEDAPQGVFNQAQALAAIEKTEDWMRAHPNIGFTGSYVQFLKIVNMLMMTPEGSDPDLALFHVPSKQFIANNMSVYGDPEDPEFVPNPNEIVSGFNGLLDANTAEGELASFVDNTWNEGVIMGFVNTMDPVKTHQTVKDIQEFLANHQNELGFNLLKWGFVSGDTIIMPETKKVIQIENSNTTTVAVGGFLGATEATHDVAVAEWLSSPLITALAIFIIVALMFKSLLIAGILTSTLLITLFAQYGLGAYFTSVQNWSGNLHFATLVSLSIAMGLGVDYGIYIISRLKEEMKLNAGNWQKSLEKTLETTGSAVFFSIIVLLASFIPLLMTQLANTWALGVFISEALIIDVVLALTIIPLMIYALKPKYIFKKTPN